MKILNASNSPFNSDAIYNGIIELSDNFREQAVTLNNLASQSYIEVHGSYNLFHDGNANLVFWSGINRNATLTSANTNFGLKIGIKLKSTMEYSRRTYNEATINLRMSGHEDAFNLNVTELNGSKLEKFRLGL